MPVPDLFEPVVANAREAARALRAARRGLILAAIAALVCLLLADLLGASEEGTTLAAVLGAVAGKTLDILEARFEWGARWLAGIAALLALLKLPGMRNWLIARTRSAVATTPPRLGSPSTTTANVATAAGSMVIGALVALSVGSVVMRDEDPPPTADDEARVFATPEEAIAAHLALSTLQYVGPCDGSRMEPPRSSETDRRVCSIRMRAQQGGHIYGYVSAGGRTRSPLASPGVGTDLAILREDQGGWERVRCLGYCPDAGQPVPP